MSNSESKKEEQLNATEQETKKASESKTTKFRNPFKKVKHVSEEEDIYAHRYVDVPKKQKKKLGTLGKAMLALLGVILIGVLIWVGYLLVHYYFYNDYQNYLTGYEYEEGTEFVPIEEASSDVEGMVLAAENEYLKLYTNPETAEVAIYDKRTGEITYSNPVHADEDPIANETNRNYLKSQFILEYFNSGRTTGIFDSYSASVEKGQVSIVALEDGIRYTYKVGEVGNATGIVPRFIRPERFEEIVNALSPEDGETLRGYFKESEEVTGFMEMRSSVSKSTAILETMNIWFESAGFTADDYVEELTAAGKENLLSPNFVIELEYRLNQDGLDVSVPMCSLVEGGGAKIYRLQVLKFFGAADDTETGYMVVPNGSGSIIYFNNGRTNNADYSQYIYGMDPLAQSYTLLENTETARLPLFGISGENRDILVTIEDGASLSFVTASIAGKVNSYNYVYNTFVLRGYDVLSMFGTTGNEGELPILEKEYYDCNLSLRYSFLTEDYSGYSGMANYYRERLIAEGVLTERTEGGDIPFYYDVIGGVKKTSYILGVQYLSVYPMTTFEEAGQMSNELAELGITNQVMNLQGWFNGGYYHDVPDRLRVTWKLGGRSGLEELNALVTANGGEMYGDVAFQEVSFISSRYNYLMETARYYGAGYVASFGQVNPATLRQTSSMGYEETQYDLLSPRYLPRYVEEFAGRVENVDIYGIGLRDLGDVLLSDKKRTHLITREEALDVVIGQLERLAATNRSLLVSGGNDYTFAYTQDIINAPVNDNDFFIIDQDIPFYQMVVHGYIDYCGDQINGESSANLQEDILQMIEYGAAPHYVFTWESATEMKYTGLNRFYATTFANWRDPAVELYNEVNAALTHVQGAEMILHEAPESELRKVTYDNGVVIYINYSDRDITADGVVVPANDYAIGGVASE